MILRHDILAALPIQDKLANNLAIACGTHAYRYTGLHRFVNELD